MFVVLPSNLKIFSVMEILPHCMAMVVCVLLIIVLLRTYEIIWCYGDKRECLFLVAADICGCCLCFVVGRFILADSTPFMYIISAYMLSLLLVLCLRFIYRQFKRKLQKKSGVDEKNYIAIIGSGYAGITLIDEIKCYAKSKYKPYSKTLISQKLM